MNQGGRLTMITGRTTPPPTRQRRLINLDTPSSYSSSNSTSSDSTDDALEESDDGPRKKIETSQNIADLASSLSLVNLADLQTKPGSAYEDGFLSRSRTNTKQRWIKLLDCENHDDSASSAEFAEHATSQPFSSSENPIDVNIILPTKKGGDSEQAKNGVWHLDYTKNEYSLVATGTVKVPNICIPADIYDNLFDHQRDGISWMAGLHTRSIGLALCDDMGMGKSRTTLAFLGGLMRTETIRNALIVAPLSVLRSWEGEAHKVLRACVPGVRISVASSSTSKSIRYQRLQDALEW
jgi:SNF2 family DNA or RNA helicase